MKKRIALAAAIALAISVGGMLPASAAKLGAPVITGTTLTCSRAGGTLEVKAPDADLKVSLGTGVLVIEESHDQGTTEAWAGITGCLAGDLSLTGLTSVILKADDVPTSGVAAEVGNDGSITVVLGDASNVFNYGSIPMSIQAENGLVFDGSALAYTGGLKSFSGVIGEETFTIGSVTGAYYAAALAFKGSTGADVLDASGVVTTDVTLWGGTGNDTLKGGAGDDYVYGGAPSTTNDGDDVLYGNAGDDHLFPGDGSSGCKTLPAKASGCPAASGTGGVDQGWGGPGNDMIASDGADTVAPGDGMDVVTGNVFQLNYSDSSAAISLDLTTLGGLVKSAGGDDYYEKDKVTEFVGSAFADTMIGSSANDKGEGGADYFYGGAGADKLLGLSGSDVLWGSGGADTIKGGAGNDTISGDSGADVINGGNGNDTVEGGSGDDVMYGSAGDDILRGRKGSDQAWGGKGTFDVCAAEVVDSCEFKK